MSAPIGSRLWLAVLGLSADQLVAWGVLYYAYAVLSVPLSDGLGVSKSFVAAAFSVCLLVSGGLAPAVGRLFDRGGTRGALVAGVLVGTLALGILANAHGGGALLAAFVLLGVAQALSLYEAAFRTVVGWCPVEPARSRALLSLTSVAGFASTVFVPLTTWLVVRWGWRAAVVGLAVALATTLVPLRLMLPLPIRPSEPDGVRSATPVPLPRSATWLAVVFALQGFGGVVVSLDLVWHRVELGDSLAGAAAVAGLAGAAQVPGRLFFAFVRRRGPSLLPLLSGLQAVGLLGIALGTGIVGTAAVLLFGAANGMMTLERASVLVDWYGQEVFGTHNGRVAAVSSIAKAVAPFLVALLHTVVSYATVFEVLAALLVVGAGCSVVAGIVHGSEPAAGARSEGAEEIAADRASFSKGLRLPGESPRSNHGG